MSTPAITVIIPAYNARQTIGETLDSLEAQICRDFTAVVVDDGSTDGTAEFVRESYPRVTVVTQANGGPAAARNRGAAEATTPWLAFLDADDSWLPWRLSLQLAYAAEDPEVVLWAGGFTEIAATGSVRPPDPGSPPPITWLELDDFVLSNQVMTTTVLLRREVFVEAGGFDTRFRGPEDYDLWLRVAAVGKVGRIEFPLTGYRYLAASLSHAYERFLPEVLRVLDKAYGEGGVLSHLPTRRRSVAMQIAAAGIMAREHGHTLRAVALVCRSLWVWPWPIRYGSRTGRKRWRVLAATVSRIGTRGRLEAR